MNYNLPYPETPTFWQVFSLSWQIKIMKVDHSKKAMSGTRRIDNIKKRNVEEIRRKFKAAEYINQLQQCYEEYEKMSTELSVAQIERMKLQSIVRKPTVKTKAAKERQLLEKQEAKDSIGIINAQLDILRARLEINKQKIDLNMRRLKFCIPELRSIEFRDSNGDNPFEAFAEAVAALSDQ